MNTDKLILCFKILSLVTGTKDGITFKEYQKYKNMVKFLTPYSVMRWLEAFGEKPLVREWIPESPKVREFYNN